MNNKNIRIFPYVEEHRQKIFELIIKIQKEEFGFSCTINDPPGLENITSSYQESGGNFWVAMEGENMVGTIGLQLLNSNQAALKRMYVAKDYRGKNYQIAKRLLDHLVHWCQQKGVEKVYLGTRAAYLAAHRFYEKNNFREIPKNDLPPQFPIASVDTKFYQRHISFSNACFDATTQNKTT